jgi:hypothetical protein
MGAIINVYHKKTYIWYDIYIYDMYVCMPSTELVIIVT